MGREDLRIHFSEAVSEPLLLKERFEELSTHQQTILKVLYGCELSSKKNENGFSEVDYWAAGQGFGIYDDLGYLIGIKDHKLIYVPSMFNEGWIVGGRRLGKALDVETEIPTPTGWKRFGDLKVGDWVIARDGKSTKVTLVTEEMKNHKCYRVTFSDGQEIIADAEHKWFVRTKAARKSAGRTQDGFLAEQVVTTQEMVDHGIKTRNGRESEYAVDVVKTKLAKKEYEIDPYLLGVWLGDGTTKRAEITTADEEILEAFRAGNYIVTHRQDYTWGITGKEKFNRNLSFAAKLTRLGVIGNKHIPQCYLRTSVEDRIALLQGLMDTDGYAGKNICIFYTTNDQLKDGVVELINSLGMKANVGKKKAICNGKDCGFCWVINFSADFVVFRLKRKQAKQHIAKAPWRKFRYIVGITEVESRPVKCIKVERTEGFLVGRGFIPTHNTDAIMSTIVAYEATLGGHEGFMRKGQQALCFQIAQDMKMARNSLHFIKATIESSSVLKKLIANVTADAIELGNGLSIAVVPPTLKSVRGYANPCAVMDEIGVWYQDSDAANPDYEVYRAVKPGQTQFPNAMLLAISSPWNKSGLLYRYWEAGTNGQNASKSERDRYEGCLVWHVPTAASGNPRIKKTWLRAERDRDPRAFEREYLAIFQDSVSGFLSSTLLQEAVEKGVVERPPDPLCHYVAAMDPAFKRDAFGFAVCHATNENKIVFDVLRRWQGETNKPLNPMEVLTEIADICKRFKIPVVYSDQYHMESLQQLSLQLGFSIQGIPFTSQNKSSIYGNLQQLLNQKRLVLLDDYETIKELKMVEREVTGGGAVQISAPKGEHDDMATVVALAADNAIWLLPDKPKKEDDLRRPIETPFETIMKQLKRVKSESLEWF